MPKPGEVAIIGLGAQGDGVADTTDGPQYVPFALPGEVVRVGGDGLPELLSAPSPARRRPPCRHFGVCGGCVAQHMDETLYADWKRSIVVDALRQRGLEAEVAPLVRIGAGTRRRAVLAARREARGIMLGYHRRRSHDLFALEECPVLEPAIVNSLQGLCSIAAALGRAEVRLTVLSTPAGLDVATDAGGPTIDPRTAAALAQLASTHRVARISIGSETILHRSSPALDLGGIAVTPPPGTFAQAVAEAEAVMIERVAAAVGKSRRVADLFAGIGTFALPLARTARVLAVDGDERALAALADAARRASGLKPIETRRRDLFREPLSSKELEDIDAVVLDPPRAGARAQAEALAKSAVPVVVAVSCDPGTLARDARILVDGGYTLDSVTPVDQFLFSAHVEAVAVLRRSRARKRATGKPN
jgi:23S rRNA (uracil1939-C5)-methyltransferase